MGRSVRVVVPLAKPFEAMTPSEKVQNLHQRVGELEEVFDVAGKIWNYLKVMTPAIIVGLAASMNTESAGYKIVNAVAVFMGWSHD